MKKKIKKIRFALLQVGLAIMATYAHAQTDVKSIKQVASDQIETARGLFDVIVEIIVKYGFQVLGGIIVLVVGWLVAGYIEKIVNKMLQSKNVDVTVSKFIVGTVKLLVMAFAVIVALGKFGIEIAPLIAGISVAGFGLSFVLLTTLPLLEGNIANAEIFMILPVTAGLLLFWHAWESRRKIPIKIWLSIGVLLAAGFLFKVTAVFELAALSVFSVFLTAKNHHLWFIIAGFVTPILVTILYYLARGAGELYIRSVLLQNIGYLSSWTSGSNSNLFINSFIMLGSLAVLFLLRRQLKSNFLFISQSLSPLHSASISNFE